jgi:hypothetical protein
MDREKQTMKKNGHPHAGFCVPKDTFFHGIFLVFCFSSKERGKGKEVQFLVDQEESIVYKYDVLYDDTYKDTVVVSNVCIEQCHAILKRQQVC